jgi:hypothetical protein
VAVPLRGATALPITEVTPLLALDAHAGRPPLRRDYVP